MTWSRIPAGGRQTTELGIFDKRSREGQPWTTSAGGQNGIWTRDLRISNPPL